MFHLVTCNQEIFGSKTGNVILPFSNLQPGKKIIKASLESHNWIGGPTSVMFRKSNLKVGGFLDGFSWLPDWDMWLKQLSVGDCYIIPDRLVHYRMHSTQATVLLTENYSTRFEEYEFFKIICKDNRYQLEGFEKILKKIKRRKASSCVRLGYKSILNFRRKNIPIIKKAAGIAVSEMVFF